MRARCLWVLALAPGLVQAQESRPETKPPALNVGGLDVKGAGTVAGIVKFKGKLKPRKPLKEIAGNAFCGEQHKEGAPLAETWVYGRNGEDDTLANVLVYVSKGLEGKKFEAPKEPVVLDQVNCIYTPHVVGIMVGQTLEVRNSDATLHNVMCNPLNNRGFNVGMAVKGSKLERVFPEPEFKVNLRCFMHPWMSAYVHVLPHPFYAVTQGDGTFTIRGLPPGEYEVSVMHEAAVFEARPARAGVKVAAGEVQKIEFTYQVPQDK